ncbi:hypothetical protein [Microbacterium sp. NIBRBAC000506063]|uniref:hypothetical protein n=1 Tax=Microbacterium sp. NIBRBAC000506063 TaxID=2734618 RepID=UPI001BB4F468|nr:hypothetical protein [Microbacterium sp. NIBRBAC000506063]QTV79293.1 hypothetical protein KAE78_09705 [Microbacterium sp. NIBRBAC000506063]
MERRDELTELEPFDEGTMTLVKQDDVEGARVWLATRLEGDITCVIIDTGTTTAPPACGKRLWRTVCCLRA